MEFFVSRDARKWWSWHSGFTWIAMQSLNISFLHRRAITKALKFSTFVSMSAVSSFETESSRKLIPVGLIKPMLLLIVLRSVTKSVVHCNELVSYLDASVCQCIEGSGVTYVDLCFERDCHVRTCDLSC